MPRLMKETMIPGVVHEGGGELCMNSIFTYHFSEFQSDFCDSIGVGTVILNMRHPFIW